MRPRLSFVFVLACAASTWACTKIIGTTDIYYVDADASGGGPEGGADVSTPQGDGNVDTDSGLCGDTQSSGDNCGVCGHSCLGGKCDTGVCQPVAIAGQISPRNLYVDKTHVFWIEPNTAYMNEANLDGTMSILLGGGTNNLLMGLAVDSTSAYWGSFDGIILRCAIGGCGGSPATMVTLSANASPSSIAVDDTNVYWAQTDSTNSKIMKLAKTATTGAGTVLSTSTATTQSYNRIATDGAYVYFTADDGMVRRVPVAGGATTVIGKGTGSALELVIDATNVYWSVGDFMTGTINKAAKDGSSPNLGSVIAGSQDLPIGLAIDANNLFWVNAGSGIGGTSGTVMTCALSSCTPKTLAKNQLAPTNIAVDSTAIYWSNNATGNPTGALMRLAR